MLSGILGLSIDSFTPFSMQLADTGAPASGLMHNRIPTRFIAVHS